MRVRASEHGFSLPEALLAVAIFAAVMALIAPTLSNAVRTSTRVTENAAQLERIRTAENAIRQAVASAVRPPAFLNAERWQGESNEVRFLAYAPDMIGPARMRLFVEGGSEGRALMLVIEPMDNPSEETRSARLFQNVDSVAFSYYGAVSETAEPSWTQRWTADLPPRLMALNVSFKGARSRPLRLEAVIEANAPLLCDFDPVSRACRQI